MFCLGKTLKMKQKIINRRQFVFRSFLASSGVVLSTNFISNESRATINKIHVPRNLSKSNFDFGVASFDPTDSQVIIWTRYSSGFRMTEEIVWQVAYDDSFTSILREGKVETDDTRDFTVSIELQNLESNQKLYYRFISLKDRTVSEVGETLTFPKIANEIKLVACSCANYASGFFNVYKEIAKTDADVVIHLGDYIYEYGNNQYGTNEDTKRLNREFVPNHELHTLKDYRKRYKQYRQDEDLKLLHSKKPFICVWDDHEIANDTYREGAQNHSISEGSFSKRKQGAIQAFSEYLPVKTNNNHIIYRDFNLGNLVNLMMLDTRVVGRDKQLCYSDFYDNEGEFDFSTFQSKLFDENRTLLGIKQRDWLIEKVNASKLQWQVLGQQVLMGKMYIPKDLLLEMNRIKSHIKKTGTVQKESLESFKGKLLSFTKLKMRHTLRDSRLTDQERNSVEETLPYNLDAWDGYPVERERIFNTFGDKKIISLAGDTHNAWCTTLSDTLHNLKGEEFATASISSPGLETYLKLGEEEIAKFEQAMILLVNDLNYLNASQRGFMTLRFTQEAVNTDWIFVDSIRSRDYKSVLDKTNEFSLDYT